MRFADVFIRRPVFATMLIASLVVLGLFSYRGLGLDLFPNIDFPIVTVTTTLKGASVEEMETGVTKVIEEAVNTIDGIDELRSITKEGLSSLVVQFVLEKPRDIAAQDVRDKVAGVLAQLPVGTDPPVIEKFDVDAVPVMGIAISGRTNLREVTELARKQVKEDIETLSGVGQVILLGGQERAINVYVDPDRLTAQGLSIGQVRSAIQQQNLELPGGRLDQTRRELVVRTMGRIEHVPDFNDLIVAHVGDRPLRVRDLGWAEDGVVEPRTLARLNGENAVQLVVRKQSGTNTVEVIDRVKAELARLKAALPDDIEMRVIRDQSRFIKASLETVRLHLWLGAALVAFTVLLFMRDWRSTLVAGIAIPTSIVSTFTFMRYMGFTLNNLTMLGLVLAVGIVIDDAVVVLENIFRHIEEEGRPPMRAASEATAEIALAVMATTLSLVIIFLPVAFMAGRVGRFFHSFGLTVAVAIMISLLISFTLTPSLSARMLRRLPPGRVKPGEGDVTTGSIYVRLKDLRARQFSQFDVMADARWLMRQYPDLRSAVQGINPLASGGTRLSDLEINLRGPDLDKLQDYADRLMAGMRQLPGLVDIDTSLAVRTPELRLLIDRDKASDLGVNVQDIAATVQTYVAGEPVSKYKEGDEQYDIWLRAEPGKRRTPQDVYDLTVRSGAGQLVRLGNLLRVREDLGPAEIDRVNRQRSITISGNLLPALPLATAVEHVQKVAAPLDMPALYSLEFTGRAKTLAESNANFGIAFLLSIVFMYMVLAAQFESFLHPVTIMLALPLTIPFALLSLVLLGEALNVYSMLGLFMLFGVVKKNGILQIDYTNTLRARGMARDAAILEANRVRLRPILMTTVMLVFGMVPIALGRGPGSGSRGSIARVIIGGQALSLLITLLIP